MYTKKIQGSISQLVERWFGYCTSQQNPNTGEEEEDWQGMGPGQWTILSRRLLNQRGEIHIPLVFILL
jgi:hypothetical protein